MEGFDMCYIVKISKLYLLLLLFSVDLSAQVATTVSGYPVIDLSALSPLGAVLSSADASTRRTQMNQQSPSNSAYLGVGSSVSGENGTWNAKMSIKFQVMRSDLGSATDWSSGWNACKLYNGEGGGVGSWRLPTQRELIMIWGLHPLLIEKGGFSAFTVSIYWSASECNASYAWYVNFSSGFVSYYSKTTGTYRVRCVRDL